jgi:hypothetical protein
MLNQNKKEKNNPFIKDLLSVFIFLMISVCSFTLLNNVNEIFLSFILLSLVFFILHTTKDFIKIYPSLKQRYLSRTKLNLSHSFKWNYFIFINGLVISFLGFYSCLFINTTFLIAIPFGLWFSYSCIGDMLEKNKEDLQKIESWSKKLCNSITSKIDY